MSIARVERENLEYPRTAPITDERLEKLFNQIKPIVSVIELEKSVPHFIKKPESLIDTAFIWDPKIKNRAKGLIPIAVMETYHDFLAPAFFKPSVSEVLSQIDTLTPDLIDLLRGFETLTEDITFDGYQHKTDTLLYVNEKDYERALKVIEGKGL